MLCEAIETTMPDSRSEELTRCQCCFASKAQFRRVYLTTLRHQRSRLLTRNPTSGNSHDRPRRASRNSPRGVKLAAVEVRSCTHGSATAPSTSPHPPCWPAQLRTNQRSPSNAFPAVIRKTANGPPPTAFALRSTQVGQEAHGCFHQRMAASVSPHRAVRPVRRWPLSRRGEQPGCSGCTSNAWPGRTSALALLRICCSRSLLLRADSVSIAVDLARKARVLSTWHLRC